MSKQFCNLYTRPEHKSLRRSQKAPPISKQSYLPQLFGDIFELYENAFQLLDHHLHVAADALSLAGDLRGFLGRSSTLGHPSQAEQGRVGGGLSAGAGRAAAHVWSHQEPQCY